MTPFRRKFYNTKMECQYQLTLHLIYILPLGLTLHSVITIAQQMLVAKF